MLRLSELNGFWSALAISERSCLLLDYDGTLAPFHVEREKAVPYSGVSEVLADLIANHHTRVVIISGRAAQDLPPLLGLPALPEIWGCHGLERLSRDGSYAPPVLPDDVRNALTAARHDIDALGLADYIEVKPGGLALHWRGLDRETVEQLRSEVLPRWSTIADNSRLGLRSFDGGLELRCELITKADAVAQVLAVEPPESCAAYLGDDFTDEDAFGAIAGRGLGVLVRSELRDSLATAWLVPPDELLAFLNQWNEACR